MKDEYLWDKSGEPDEEIQQLEEILGTLKYKPQPLNIPKDLIITHRRSYVPLVAIAASILFVLAAAGLWLTRNQNRTPQVAANSPTAKAIPESKHENNEAKVAPTAPTISEREPHRRLRSRINVSTATTAKQREEAIAAKQQLMLALRVASEKLSLAQRKTLNPSAPSQIRNQHKVG